MVGILKEGLELSAFLSGTDTGGAGVLVTEVAVEEAALALCDREIGAEERADTDTAAVFFGWEVEDAEADGEAKANDDSDG